MAVKNNVGVYNQVFQGTPYIFANTRNPNGRIVEKYCLNNQMDQAAAKAAQAVRILLENHQNLRPTFATNEGALEREVAGNIYLTINGNSVSLATEQTAPDGAPREAIDRYFSETLMQEPTQCPQGHWFELNRARFWAANMQNVCPAGGHPHLIGNLAIDDDLQSDIQGFVRNRQHQQQIQRNLVDRQQLMVIDNANLRIQQQRQQQEINVLANQVTGNLWSTVGTVAGSGGKVLTKVAVTKEGAKIFAEIAKMASQKLALEGGKTTGKTFAKSVVQKLPVVSLCVGVVAACSRAYHGQWARASGELASGAAACFPGIGRAASITVDIAMGCYDIYEIYNPAMIENPPPIQIELNMAYKVVGIDFANNNNPTREEVDHAYRAQTFLIHSDRSRELMLYSQEQLNAMLQALNLCRDQIYQARGWA